jgi:uncharacterized membrane protein YidH (DUF202 family)
VYVYFFAVDFMAWIRSSIITAEDFLVNCITFQINKYNTNKTRNLACGRFQVHVFAYDSYAVVTVYLSIGDNGFIE